jgi:1-acyl-sn-glycerol-3-phosphate acyltransferase
MRSWRCCSVGSPKNSAIGSSIIAWSCTESRSIAAADHASLNLRALLRIGAVLLLFLALAPVHLLIKLVAQPSPIPPIFLRLAGRIVGLRVQVTGQPIAPHTLLLANHVSWLDILVLAGATGCAFVSKDQLGHPMVHWLADQNHTIYVNRNDRRGAREQAVMIARALTGQTPVTLFPEGRTSPGACLLPFRSTLLEAANYAGTDVAIRPVAIDYGAEAAQLAWFEEPGKNNVLRMLGRKGVIPVTLRLLPPPDRNENRKQLAGEAWRAIAEALGFKSDEPSPIAEAE